MAIKIQSNKKIHSTPQIVNNKEAPKTLLTGLWGVDKTDSPLLLAFADDGLIWGKMTEEGLFISNDADPQFGPLLRWQTLQRLHLFSEKRELRIWRYGMDFKGVFLSDEPGEDEYYYDEEQILLGTIIRDGFSSKTANNTISFTPVEDLAGQWHAPPIAGSALPEGSSSRLRLKLRHYLKADEESGMLRVSISRILKLLTKEEKK